MIPGRNKKLLRCSCYPNDECVANSKVAHLLKSTQSQKSSDTKQKFCLTTEGCFRSFRYYNNKEYSLRLGCFMSETDRYSMQCDFRKGERLGVLCCRDKDFCNKKLKVPGEEMIQGNFTRIPVKQTGSQPPVSFIHIAFWISLPLAVIFVLSCLFLLLWKYLKNSKTQQLNFKKIFSKSQSLPTTKIQENLQKQLLNNSYYGNNSLSKGHYGNNFISNGYYNNSGSYSNATSLLQKYSMKYPYFPQQLPLYYHNNDAALVGYLATGQYCVDTLSGVPGSSKSSSGIVGKSNHTVTTLLPPDNSSNECTMDKLADITCTSGSGRGLTHLVQRTVARQITLQDCIGNGKFGKVWKAQFQGETVAVKIFSSREESSWARETKIYTTILLRHDNILGFYASDLISQSGCTELWMVMQYHERGSLYEYLRQPDLVVDINKAVRLAHSAAAGLSHLHTHIMGLQGKPPIAHRDIKSRNILVKSNDTCCIADLGLAVYPDPSDPDIAALMSGHDAGRVVGTRRYICPEFLECACKNVNIENNLTNKDSNNNNNSYSAKFDPVHPMLLRAHADNFMESMKAGDVYSFALVIWEIVNRINFNNEPQLYKIPFEDMVPSDPSFEEMYDVVVTKGLRPPISDNIRTHLNPIVRILEECWHQRVSIRHSMLRVKKSLSILLASVNAKVPEVDTTNCQTEHICSPSSSSSPTSSSSSSLSSLEVKCNDIDKCDTEIDISTAMLKSTLPSAQLV